MTLRKKKIFFIQFVLLLSGLIIILYTFLKINKISSNKIFSKETKIQIDKKINKENKKGNIFYDIEYSGIDLSGNRYILKAKEAENVQNIEGLLDLKFVNAIFYFKDDKVLNISSEKGKYNNKTLDMIFEKNVFSEYDGSILQAEKAEYFNSKNVLIISKDVKINDYKGSLIADKLIFDIEKNTLNISSYENKKVNANLNYK